jgi:hypothetical protein
MTENIQQLMNYGVLGLFATLMIWVIWYLEKQRTRRESELLQRLAKMEVKMDIQQVEHDSFMKNEYVKSAQMNEKCLAVLEEVKDLLQNKNL